MIRFLFHGKLNIGMLRINEWKKDKASVSGRFKVERIIHITSIEKDLCGVEIL